MTQRRRRYTPNELIAHLLGHRSGSLLGIRCPADFRAQFVAKTPGIDLRDALSTTFADADELLLAGEEVLAALLHEAGVGRALISTDQLGLADLVVLDSVRHIERDQQHQIQRIKIPACESSQQLAIDIALPSYLRERLERHLQVFRPLRPGAEESTSLFPARSDTKLAGTELRARLGLVALWSNATNADN